MIRDRFMRFCIGLLVVGLLVTGFSLRRPFDRKAAPPAAATVTIEALPQRFTVDVSDLAIHLRGKPQAEVDDQLRDWAVYGTLVRLGLNKDDLGKATFKTAPVRLPYLEQAFLFDYGRGRRALVGDGRAILFCDGDDPDPTATIGRLADKVRMETGEIPARFDVLTITPDLSTNTIAVERRPAIEGAKVFGPDYGYVEKQAASLADFEAWLGQIDDVTYAGVREGVLHLGGRRFAKTRTKNVTVEDVAALLQAQNELAAGRARLEERETQIKADLENEIRRTRLSQDQLVEKYKQRMKAELMGVSEAPGFSLDPQWNPKGLAEALEKAAADPCSLDKEALDAFKVTARTGGAAPDASPAVGRNSLELCSWTAALHRTGNMTACRAARDAHGAELRAMANAVRQAETESDPKRRANALDAAMLPLWRMKRDLQSESTKVVDPASEVLFDDLLGYLKTRYRVQCARYDGLLAGTRVGMNLFYTDLLAKLWESVDYHHASPGIQVPGFLSTPRMRLEDKWLAEEKRLPNTRLWFAPKPDGYTRSKGGDSVWFEHIATRVFAAGSDPANPGKEEQPAEGSRRSLTWWDRHYGAVADYEQQYHVQNQIEKWSLITGWWKDKLQYLSAVRVDHEQRFDRWYAREKPGLRYQYPMQLRPEADWVTGTECLDLLGSYSFAGFDSDSDATWSIEGGVSLGSRAAVEAAPMIEAEEAWALRQVVPKVAEGPWKTVRSTPLYEGPGKVAVRLAQATPTRMGGADLGLRTINVRYSSLGNTGAKVALESEKGAIGSIVARRQGEWVGLRWDPGEVHAALLVPNSKPAPVGASAVERALGALKEGDHPRALHELTEASGGDPARLQASVDALRSRALEDAEARFGAGDSFGAGRSYQAAEEMLGDLPPEAKMKRALVDIERGQVKRGLDWLTAHASPSAQVMLATAGKKDLAELHGLVDAQEKKLPSLFGKMAADVRRIPEAGELLTVLAVEVRQQRVVLLPERRVALLTAHEGDVVVYVRGFSFNAVDFEASQRGMLADLARSPDVQWTVVERMGGVYKPSVIVEADRRFYRMPVSSNAAMQADFSGVLSALNGTSHVVFIENCDRNHDGVVSDEERAACKAA